MKKLLCTIQDTSHMIQIKKKRLDQNHINYSVEPIKSNFFSDLVHMIFYRDCGPGIATKNEGAAFMWRRILMRRRKR